MGGAGAGIEWREGKGGGKQDTRTGVDLAGVDGDAEDGDGCGVEAPLEVFREQELHRLRHRCVRPSRMSVSVAALGRGEPEGTGMVGRVEGGRTVAEELGEQRVLEVAVEVVEGAEAYVGGAGVVPC